MPLPLHQGTRQELADNDTALLPDNPLNAITPANVRAALAFYSASTWNLADDGQAVPNTNPLPSQTALYASLTLAQAQALIPAADGTGAANVQAGLLYLVSGFPGGKVVAVEGLQGGYFASEGYVLDPTDYTAHRVAVDVRGGATSAPAVATPATNTWASLGGNPGDSTSLVAYLTSLGLGLNELALPQQVQAGKWYVTASGIWAAKQSFNAQAPPAANAFWRLVVPFASGGQNLSATAAGLRMLQAASASAQRALLNGITIGANQYASSGGSHPAFSQEDGTTGVTAWLLGQVAYLLTQAAPSKAPAAPTSWITDDTADTGSGLLVSGYPALSDYEAFGVPGLPGTVPATSVPGADVQNGRLTLRGLTGSILVGNVGFRVAASGNRPAGASLTNNVAYTASGTTTPGGTYTPSGDESGVYTSATSSMPNQINAFGTVTNSTQPAEFQNPKTGVWVTGTATTLNGVAGFAAVLPGVDGQLYPVGTLNMRVKGFPTVYTNQTEVRVTASTTPVVLRDLNLGIDGNSIGTEGYAPGWHSDFEARFRSRLAALPTATRQAAGVTTTVVFNWLAISGQTTNDMDHQGTTGNGRADVAAAYVAGKANVLLTIGEPYNAVRYPYQNTTATQAAADYQQLCADVKADKAWLGIIGLMGFVDHYRGSDTNFNPPPAGFAQKQADIISALRAAISASTSKVDVIAAVDPVLDTSDPTQSDDGTHPNRDAYTSKNIIDRAIDGIFQFLFGIAQSPAIPAPGTGGNTGTLSISSLSPTSTGRGRTVTLAGTGFSAVTRVTINGQVQPSLVVASDTSLSFVVSDTATTGPPAVATAAGATATSSSPLTIDTHLPVGEIYLRPLVEGAQAVSLGTAGDFQSALANQGYADYGRTGDKLPANTPWLISTEYYPTYSDGDATIILLTTPQAQKYDAGSNRLVFWFLGAGSGGPLLAKRYNGANGTYNTSVVAGMRYGAENVLQGDGTYRVRLFTSVDGDKTRTYFPEDYGAGDVDFYLGLNPNTPGRADWTTTKNAVQTT